jgi:hypothetical protein
MNYADGCGFMQNLSYCGNLLSIDSKRLLKVPCGSCHSRVEFLQTEFWRLVETDNVSAWHSDTIETARHIIVPEGQQAAFHL